jgi:ABC-type glycerol-3-phosphate transport system substrate-binding protein
MTSQSFTQPRTLLKTAGRTRTLSLLSFLGFLLWTFCTQADPGEDRTIVTIFSLPNPSNTNPGNLAAYEVVRRFHELHPDIRLQSSTPLQIEGMGMDAAPLMSIAGGTSPDIIYVNFRQSDTYIREGFLYPLDEYFSELSPEEISERVPASILPVVYREGPGGRKHYWAMPEEIVVTVLLYRKDLFSQAGLDATRPPKDWSEMRAFAEVLADPSKGRYGFSLRSGPAGAWGILPFVSSAGGQAVTLDKEGNWRACFDTEGAVRGYRFAAELAKSSVTKHGRTGPVVYRGADVYAVNAEGRVGMYFGYLGGREVAKFNPDVVAVAPVPAGPTGHSSAENGMVFIGGFCLLYRHSGYLYR